MTDNNFNRVWVEPPAQSNLSLLLQASGGGIVSARNNAVAISLYRRDDVHTSCRSNEALNTMESFPSSRTLSSNVDLEIFIFLFCEVDYNYNNEYNQIGLQRQNCNHRHLLSQSRWSLTLYKSFQDHDQQKIRPPWLLLVTKTYTTFNNDYNHLTLCSLQHAQPPWLNFMTLTNNNNNYLSITSKLMQS